MKENTPQRRAWIIAAATLLIAVLLIGLGGYVVTSKQPSLLAYWIPLTFAIALIAIKLAWPKIPAYQLALLYISAVVIHIGMEHYGPPANLLSEFVLEFVCSGVFGAFWVHRGYCSKEANHW